MLLDKLERIFENRREVFEKYVPTIDTLLPAETKHEKKLRRVTRRVLHRLRQGEGAEEAMVLNNLVPAALVFVSMLGLPADKYVKVIEALLRMFGFEERMHGKWLDAVYQAYEDRPWWHPARLLQIFPSPLVWLASQFVNLFVLPISCAVIFAAEIAVKEFYDQYGKKHPHAMIRKLFLKIGKQEKFHILLHSYLYALWLRAVQDNHWIIPYVPKLWTIIIWLVWGIVRPLPLILGEEFKFSDFHSCILAKIEAVLQEAKERVAETESELTAEEVAA